MARVLVSLLKILLLIQTTAWAHPGDYRHRTFGSVGNREADAPILVLDVDNTLYSEKQLRARGFLGVEQQIVQNTHEFCRRHLNMSPQQADELYRQYGSTIEGIRNILLANNTPAEHVKHIMGQFYHEVYDPIDASALVQSSSSHGDSTGYSHSSQGTLLKDMLQAAPGPVYLSSNSPSWHVHKVVRHLGLAGVPWAGILTPDTIDGGTIPYPTKSHPSIFYQSLLQKHPHRRVILLDDSNLNLKLAAEHVLMEGIHVSEESQSLEKALGMAWGHLESDESAYRFSEIRYLAAKNLVDANSIHAPTWQQVAHHLSELLPGDGILCIADLGAGILSTLELVLMGHNEKIPPLDFLLESRDTSVRQIHYYAYESNLALFMGCRATLTRLGFVSQNPHIGSEARPGDEYIFHHTKKNVTVHLRMRDFTQDTVKNDPPPHLIVGCCFADLMEPDHLLQSLYRFLHTWKGVSSTQQVLAYFPITFAGTTQFFPPKPFAFDTENGSERFIPSDTTAFRLYASALEQYQGHNLDPFRLEEAMKAHGDVLLARGFSNWIIDPIKNSYFWNTMMYFFGTVGAPAMMTSGWDAAGWIKRARKEHPAIVVSNVDLLFSLQGHLSSPTQPVAPFANRERDLLLAKKEVLTVEEIQFVAPYQVTTTKRVFNTKHASHLAPTQVEVTSVCSLVSSGTELKIFKGLFDDDALDVNIKGMAEERMSYPLAYGYSLVGRVTQCGSEVKDADEILGRLVFTFSPHASHAIVERESLHLVPDGVEARDAVFMPSVETALSLVHDAHIRIGEKVAIFGQGLIGLLVTSILRLQTDSLHGSSGRFGTVTAFDTIPERLAAASAMGASQALLPSEVGRSGPFEISIEVSGNSRALQSAIDHTVSGGRIIIGSWYGNSDVSLKLGIDFHRSHKTIITSQVSELRAELTGLWSKQRRFAFTWELVKRIRPSKLVTRTAPLSSAQEVYELLDKGMEIAVCFEFQSD